MYCNLKKNNNGFKENYAKIKNEIEKNTPPPPPAKTIKSKDYMKIIKDKLIESITRNDGLNGKPAKIELNMNNMSFNTQMSWKNYGSTTNKFVCNATKTKSN